MLSLAGRLWLWLVAVALASMLVVNLSAGRMVEDLYYFHTSEHLMHQVQAAANSLTQEPSPENLRELEYIVGGRLFLVSAEQLRVLSSAAGRASLGVPPLDAASAARLLSGNTAERRDTESGTLLVAAPRLVGTHVVDALVLMADTTPVRDAVNRLRRLLVGTGLGTVAALTLIALFVSRRLSRPVVEMMHMAQAMARGDFARRVQISGSDEIGALGRSINRLAEVIQAHITRERELDRMRREFLANVSHDLRTPLSLIRGYTDALRDEVADPHERAEVLDIISEEVGRLQGLVAAILDLARLDAGVLPLHRDEVRLPDVARRVIKKIGVLAGEKNVQISFAADGDPPPVWADPARIEQVLWNLLDNAVKHTPAGSGVMIHTEATERGVKVSVTDQGPGLPSEEQALVWERFYRGDQARTRRGSSTGLGLAIVRGIVEAHGGTVGVESQPGAGSTFWFVLPTLSNFNAQT